MLLCVGDETLLPALMSPMYHMMELLHRRATDGRGNVMEDEGVGCRANQMPRLLAVIVNILTKTPAVDQVTAQARSLAVYQLPLDPVGCAA